MKGMKFIGAMVVLSLMIAPMMSQIAYAAEAGHIAYLLPAESVEVETGGGETIGVLMEPTAFTHDAGNIAYLLPAESVEVETGAGEGARVLMAPTEFRYDRIELLYPAK